MALMNSSQNYSYLKIPTDVVQNIKHNSDDISQWDSTTNKMVRKIYNNQKLEPTEQSLLNNIVDNLKKSNINYEGVIPRNAELLRFNKYSKEIHETIANIAYYVQYVTDMNKMKLTMAGQTTLQNGIIYLGGRDKKFRPTLIINAYKLQISDAQSIQGFLNALIYMMKLIEDNLLTPGYVENINVIIETNSVETTFQIAPLREIINLSTKLFPARVSNIFIMNLSQAIIKKNWKMIESCLFENQKNAIKLVHSLNLREIRYHYHSAELEQKYGGTVANVTSFWPPVSFVNQSFYYQPNNTSQASQAYTNQSNPGNRSYEPLMENNNPIINNNNQEYLNQQQPKQIYNGLENYDFQFQKQQQNDFSNNMSQQQYNQQESQVQQLMDEENLDLHQQNLQNNNETFQPKANLSKPYENSSNEGIFWGLCYRSKNRSQQQQELGYEHNEIEQDKDKQKNVAVCLIF